ncbi:hypothetical protein TWF102_008129 [Orbilia oligospora]|uniref:Uncharacterized protein n=1 Tax=Orbilia oligospora TaxID=2813651 RepID=A0A7C8NJ38_ORBOL|nr:hypothetical protein TWF102_008129 [Orbilia oligospora]
MPVTITELHGQPNELEDSRQLAIASFFPIYFRSEPSELATLDLEVSTEHIVTSAYNPSNFILRKFNQIILAVRDASVILSVYRETPLSVYDKKDTQV